MFNKTGINFLVVSVAFSLLAAACAPQVQAQEMVPVTGVEEPQGEIMEEEAMEEAAVQEEAAALPEEELTAPLLMPGDPPEPERTLKDVVSWYMAHERRATDGDRFLDSLYERPFTSEEMIYQPDLDIIEVDFAYDEQFFYFTIRLYGMNLDQWGLNGFYGVDFDFRLDGRGELIVLVENPGAEWSAENVMVYVDQNRDVGGPQPLVADAGFSGTGFDKVEELAGDASAMARIDPQDEAAVQIAVSRSLLGDPEQFLWGAWADNGLREVGMFDYNDTMGPGEAGSPYRGDVDYPLKGLYNLDNTCRLPYGFAQSGNYPGMCKIGIPPTKQSEPGQPDEPGCPPGTFPVEGQCLSIPF